MPKKSILQRSGLSKVLPVGLFLIGVLASIGGALWYHSVIHAVAEIQFGKVAEQISDEVDERFRLAVHGLMGLRGMYAVLPAVRHADFLAYVKSRNLPVEFPGIRGFGFMQHVLRQDANAYVKSAQANDAPQFAIRQLDERTHDDLYVIRFIEPAADNAGAQGLDAGSESARRKAAEDAVDSGKPTLTGPVQLVQDQKKMAGVLLYVPVYSTDAVPESIELRRKASTGLLYAPIVINELLQKLPALSNYHLAIEILDSLPGQSEGALMYASARDASPVLPGDGAKWHFQRVVPLQLFDRTLTLKVSSTEMFGEQVGNLSPWLVFMGGTIVSALFAFLMHQQVHARQCAEARAAEMTSHLRRDQERFADFSQCASDWFWETDVQHRFSFLSANFEASYGRSPDQVLGRSRKELLARDEFNAGPATLTHLAQLDAHAPFRDFEYRIIGSNGEVCWVSVSGMPHDDDQGRFAGYRGTGSIITTRKQLALEVASQRRRLAEIIECTNVGTWEWSVPTGEVTLNDRWAAMVGYTLDELAPITIATWNRLAHPDDLVESGILLDKHFSRELDFYAAETRIRHKDGHWIWVSDTGRVVTWTEDGKPLLMSGTHLDISARKHVEAELEEYKLSLEHMVESRTAALSIAKEAAESSARAKAMFLANMGHELRTPMNGIMGMTALALRIANDPKQIAYLHKVEASLARLVLVINDVLDIARLEANRLVLARIRFTLAEIFQQAKDNSAALATTKGLSLSFDAPDEVLHLPLMGDPTRLGQVLQDLVKNAVKFTAQGTITVSAGMAPELDGGEGARCLQFKVQDTGIGISAADQKRIFLPFEQVDMSQTRAYGGSGLGLALSQQLVALMRGHIRVFSVLGKGSTFSFDVLVDTVADAEKRLATLTPNLLEHVSSLNSSPISILIVDEDKARRDDMRNRLGSAVLDVFEAADGVTAFEAAECAQFDLILMSLNLPRMNGIDATYAIRGIKSHHHTPIVALVHEATEKERDECIRAGMNDYVEGPVSVEKLHELFLKWLPQLNADH